MFFFFRFFHDKWCGGWVVGAPGRDVDLPLGSVVWPMVLCN